MADAPILARAGFLAAVAGLLVPGPAGWLAAACGAAVVAGSGAFGPVFLAEMGRVARRQRLALWRAVYAAGVVAAVGAAAATALDVPRGWPWVGSATVPVAQLARFGDAIFYSFLTAQFVAVVALVPVLTAGAIAEERERRTLDFLLVSDLTAAEVVAGKLAARGAGFFSVLLTGLPLIGVLPLLGGVEPTVVVASFGAVAATACTAAAVSLLASVLFGPGKAVWAAYGVLFLLFTFVGAAGWAVSVVGDQMVEVGTAVTDRALGDWLCHHGHTVYFFGEGVLAVNPLGGMTLSAWAGSVEDAVSVWVCAARGQLLASLLAAGGTVLLLRPTSRRFADQRTTEDEAVEPAWDESPRPPVGDRPVFWKALFYEADGPRGPLPVNARVVGLIAAFVPTTWLLLYAVYDRFAAGDQGAASGGVTVARGLGLLAFGMAAARVLFQAAWSVTRERDRGSLDELLTTDLSRREIFGQFWLGALASGYRPAVWLAVTLPVAAAAGGVQAAGLVVAGLVVAATLVFAASSGLWWSVRTRTTSRSLVVAVGTALAACAGPYLTVLPAVAQATEVPEWAEAAAVALSPPAAYYAACRPPGKPLHLWRFDGDVPPLWLLAAGQGVYALAAAALYRDAARRFRSPNFPESSAG